MSVNRKQRRDPVLTEQTLRRAPPGLNRQVRASSLPLASEHAPNARTERHQVSATRRAMSAHLEWSRPQGHYHGLTRGQPHSRLCAPHPGAPRQQARPHRTTALIQTSWDELATLEIPLSRSIDYSLATSSNSFAASRLFSAAAACAPAGVPQHVGPRPCQQNGVPLAPFGQRRHRLGRPLGMPADILGQVLGEGRDNPRLSTGLQRFHRFCPVHTGRGMRRHSRDCPPSSCSPRWVHRGLPTARDMQW